MSQSDTSTLNLKKLVQKTAVNVNVATVEKMSGLSHLALTITYDNGKEFSAYEKIADSLAT